MEFKDKLIVIRKDRGLSQEGLAELVGVSRQAVAKWELGQGYPDIDNLIRLSDLFKLSIDRLVKAEANHYFISGNQKDFDYNDDTVDFLLKAKSCTYAANGQEAQASRLNSHDLCFQDGDYMYLDTYLGGEKFGGEEAVWYHDKPIWCMNYVGRVLSNNFSGEFLKEALRLVPREMPYRGPMLHQSGDYIYTCQVSGSFDWYQGYETIYCQSVKVYECYFHGGALK